MNVSIKSLATGLAFIFTALTCAGAQSGTNLVHSAERFAEGKTYKLFPTADERKAGKYDCTTFVEAVLKQAGFQTGTAVASKINIVLPGPDTNKLNELVAAKDPKIKGVVEALVSSGQGTEVIGLASLRPGDILQLWRTQSNPPRGHAGIVKSVNVARKEVVLVGAHTTGLGPKPFVLDASTQGWPVWFAVRPKQ